MIPKPDDSPIFVIGTGRSGTTLLRQMLNAHPRIHLTHEAFFYAYARFAHLQPTAGGWLDRYLDTFSFAWTGVDPDEVRSELPAELPHEKMSEAFRAVMRCSARRFEKPRYGEKSPLEVAVVGRILSDYPDPKVIYMMRDPRATVASLDRMPFGAPSTLLNGMLCAGQVELLIEHKKKIHEVRLEDLIARPKEVMSRVLEFVGEPWDDAVLDHTAHAPVEDVPPLPWFESAKHRKLGPDTGSPSWREQLGPAWIRVIERVSEFAMRRYGYEPLELEREPGRLRQFLVQVKDAPAMMASGWRAWKMARRLKAHFSGRRRYDPQQHMEDHLNLNRRAWRHYPDFEMPRVPQR